MLNYDDLTEEEIRIIKLLKGKSRMEQDQILAELERKMEDDTLRTNRQF